MKTHFKSSVDEVRYFQRHPNLATLDGSISIPDNLEPQPDNPMFAIRYKTGEVLGKAGQKVNLFDLPNILWFEHYIKAEQYRGANASMNVRVVTMLSILEEYKAMIDEINKIASNSVNKLSEYVLADGPREYTAKGKVDNDE